MTDMKLHQLFEEGTTFKVQKTVNGNITALVDFARAQPGVKHGDVSWKNVRFRVWTRGDGSKYQEPLYVEFKSPEQARKIFDLLPGKGLEVSGEFGSSKFSPAKRSAGALFVLRDKRIDVSTDSVLRNKSIWRQKP